MTTDNSPKKIRPWLKRLSYIIASGAVVGGSGLWFAHSSTMQKVYIEAIASIIKNETGLDFNANGLSFSLFQGHARLYRPSLDTDFFRADEIYISANIASLFGNSPRITKLTIVNPVSNISAARLNRIKTQSGNSNLNWRLDSLEISDGGLFIKEPEWGLPNAEVTFKASAVGDGPKQLKLNAECSGIVIANEVGALRGSANFTVDMESDVIKLRQFDFDSELLKFKVNGAFDTINNVVECGVNGSIFSQNLAEFIGEDFSGFDGRADFQASLLVGGKDNLEWTLRANGQELKTTYEPFCKCGFELEASGNTSEIDIERIRVTAGKSFLMARGTLKDTDSKLVLDGKTLPLTLLSDILHAPFLASVTADIHGVASISAPLWSADALNSLNANLKAVLSRDGGEVGNLFIDASEKRVKIDSFNLDIPDLKVSAKATIGLEINTSALSDSAFSSFNLNAAVVTPAERVAYSLDKWDIVDHLPISGEARAKARVAWSPSRGLRLNGNLIVESPLYYGATADVLTTDVKIESEQLFLENIHVRRGSAMAGGHLWLTWADLPAGRDKIRMRYESSGLPLSDGLAVGISDNKILEAMAAGGHVDGWVTLSGPYNSIVLNSEAKLYDGSIYGISIPAFSCSIKMDLDEQNPILVIPEFRLADSRENLDTLKGPLGLKGNINMNLASETWNGRITGLADSHILGMTKTPFASAQIEVGLYGSYAANYGSIVLPEGNVILREGQIKIDSNNRLEGLTGNIKVGNGLVLGTVCFQDFLYSDDTLIELDTRKNGNALTGRLNIAFSPETADTAGLAKVLTKGALDNFNLNLTANGRLSDRGLSWRADIDTLSGSAFGLEFGQQILSSLDGNSESIRLAFDLGSRNLDYGVAEPLSRLRVNGTLSLDDAKTADFGFIGTADLEQTRDVLAGVFGGSRDDFLAGFTPIGVGIMDLRLRGPMDTMGLDGVLQIRGGRLQPGGDFPYGIENLNLDLICEGRHIALKNLQGRMARGKLSGFGDIVWNNSGVESYQVQTQLDNFQYNYKPEGFQLDGSLNSLFHSTSDGKGEIKGALKATNMLYASEISLGKIIQENLIGSVPNLQNIEFDDPIDAINLNLDVELTQPWIFDTNLIKIKGMPSEKFKILGTLANPGLLGSIEFAPGGRITNILPAGDIIVEKGSIDFFDSTLMNPVINIQGQIDISPFRVNLNVQGSMDSLNIAPSSTPTLKQDEVISLLLNPAIAPVLGNYSYNNSLTSTATANGLTGAASGLLVNLALLPIQEQIRRTMGLDRVSVALRARTLGSLETDVLIGKSLNLMGKTIPVTGNYTRTSEVTTMGGQMEWRFGNLVIQFGASGSRPAGIAPSGEIRHSWSFW